jgi:hypothetical protein
MQPVPMVTEGRPQRSPVDVRAIRTPAVITTPEEYRGALLRWQQNNFNVLTPFVNISGLAPSHGIVSSLIQVNVDKAPARSTTDSSSGLPFLKGDESRSRRTACASSPSALGISTKLEYARSASSRTTGTFKAIATYRGIDGATSRARPRSEWDLRDGSDRMKGWTPARSGGAQARAAQLRDARHQRGDPGVRLRHQAEVHEARSSSAVPRRPRRVPAGHERPGDKRIVTERALGGTNALYPRGRERTLARSRTSGRPRAPRTSAAARRRRADPSAAVAKPRPIRIRRRSRRRPDREGRAEERRDERPQVDALHDRRQQRHRAFDVRQEASRTRRRRWPYEAVGRDRRPSRTAVPEPHRDHPPPVEQPDRVVAAAGVSIEL